MSYGDYGRFRRVGSLTPLGKPNIDPLEAIVGGVAVGLGKDPFVRLALDELDDLIPSLSKESLAQLENTLSSSTVAQVAEGVAQFGAMVGPGLGVFSAGRLGARALIKASSSSLLKESRDFLLHEAGTAAAVQFARTPLGLRAAEAVGGSVGFGIEGFARGKASGETNEQALERGAEQFLISLGLEGGLLALSRTPAIQRLVGSRGVSQTEEVVKGRQVETALQETVWKAVEGKAAQSPGGLSLTSITQAFRQLPKEQVEELAASTRRAAGLRGHLGPEQADAVGKLRISVERQERDLVLAERKAGVKVLETTKEANQRYYESTVGTALAQSLKSDSLSPAARLQAEQVLERLSGKSFKLPEPPKHPSQWANPPKDTAFMQKALAQYNKKLASYDARLAKAEETRLAKISSADQKLAKKATRAQAKQQEAQSALSKYEEELFQLRGGEREVAVPTAEGFQKTKVRQIGLKEVVTREELVPFYTRYMDDLARFKRDGSGVKGRLARAVGWGGALTPKEIGEVADQIAVKFAKSPETAMRELGLATAFLADGAKVASIEARAGELAYQTLLVKRFEDLATAMGKSGEFRGATLREQVGALFRGRKGDFSRPVREAFEKGGIGEVERQFTRPVAEKWQAIMNDFEEVVEQARQLGGLPKMTDLQLQQLGVRAYFPHLVTLPEGKALEQFRQRLVDEAVKKGQPLHHARSVADKTIAAMENASMGGLPKVGAVDKARQIPGTVEEIAAALESGDVATLGKLGGVIETDPFKALSTLYSQLSYRVAFGRRFGLDGRMADALGEMAVQGGAPAGRVRTLVDAVAKGERFGTAAQQRVARTITNAQILSKLGLAVIPNLTQPVNAVAAFGIQDFAKGLGRMLKPNSPERVLVQRAHGAIDAGMKSLSRTILEDVQAVSGLHAGTPLDNITRAFMGVTGFSVSEAFNRTLSGVVGIETVQSTMRKHAQGKLVGHAAAKARRQFQSLGLDLDEVIRNKWYAGNPAAQHQLLERAGYEAGRTTQFIQDVTRTPLYWHTPLGRVIFQFKTFAFNQGKFIRDNVLKEAVEGNMAPLASVLTVYPAAGHLVNEAVDLFREDPKQYNGLEAYVRDIAAVGGFGLMYSLVNSLSYRQGLDQALGPTFSDVGKTLEALVTDDPFGEIWDRQAKQPTFRLGQSLGLGAAELLGAGVEAADDLFGPTESDDLYSRILEKGKR